MNMMKSLTKRIHSIKTLTNHQEKLEVGSIKRVNIISFKFALFNESMLQCDRDVLDKFLDIGYW